VSLDGFAFQAYSIDHSDISPFRINNLRTRNEQDLSIVISPPMCRDHSYEGSRCKSPRGSEIGMHTSIVAAEAGALRQEPGPRRRLPRVPIKERSRP
jgi:hypothetical protein